MKEGLYKKIRESGGRITKIKQAIVDTLIDFECLTDLESLIAALKKRKISPNRSTLFRELSFLTNNQIILRSEIKGKIFYEIPSLHHHHLICNSCGKITSVEISNHLEKTEKNLSKTHNFSIINHILDFYGYCEKCRLTQKS